MKPTDHPKRQVTGPKEVQPTPPLSAHHKRITAKLLECGRRKV